MTISILCFAAYAQIEDVVTMAGISHLVIYTDRHIGKSLLKCSRLGDVVGVTDQDGNTDTCDEASSNRTVCHRPDSQPLPPVEHIEDILLNAGKQLERIESAGLR